MQNKFILLIDFIRHFLTTEENNRSSEGYNSEEEKLKAREQSKKAIMITE